MIAFPTLEVTDLAAAWKHSYIPAAPIVPSPMEKASVMWRGYGKLVTQGKWKWTRAMAESQGARMRLDRDKFKKLVHYIIWKCPDKAKLGSVKLHKILWKSDTRHYELYGSPITGVRYVKRQWGPAADVLLPIREELLAEGSIKFWRDRKFAGDYSKDVYEAPQPPADFLSRQEREIVDHWIEHICLDHTAASISEDTHDYAWEIAILGEELPVFAVLLKRGREPEDEELEWAHEEARRLGLI